MKGVLFGFFEFGQVVFELSDPQTRQISLKICIPCCILQGIIPKLLDHGFIDDYELRNPIAVWIPTIDAERYLPETAHKAPELPKIAENEIKHKIQLTLELFKELSQALRDPADLFPMLPMGTYVKFHYRCTVDKLAQILLELEKINFTGIPDFRFALAGALAHALGEFQE